MNVFTNLFSSGLNTVIDSVGNVIDNLVTSDEERLSIQKELETIKLESKLQAIELQNDYEKEVTKRWVSDNEHLITRLIRPLSYLWTLFLFSTIILGDGNWGFSIKDAYIPVIETIFVTMTIAYFGSRGAEKITKSIKGGENG